MPCRYIGALLNGRKHGRGICWYFDDVGRPAGKYSGFFAEGRRHGTGNFEYTDGSVYNGEFNNGRCAPPSRDRIRPPSAKPDRGIASRVFLFDNCRARSLLRDPDPCRTQSLNDRRRAGRGRYRFPDGDVYEGEWFDDEMVPSPRRPRAGHGAAAGGHGFEAGMERGRLPSARRRQESTRPYMVGGS